MLSNAYFLAKFRFGTAENEPAKNLQILLILSNFPNFADARRRAARPARRSPGAPRRRRPGRRGRPGGSSRARPREAREKACPLFSLQILRTISNFLEVLWKFRRKNTLTSRNLSAPPPIPQNCFNFSSKNRRSKKTILLPLTCVRSC